MKRTLKISNAENGYILEWEEEIENDYTAPFTEVIEGVDFDDKKTMTKLLERVAEFFGFTYDKYGRENLNIQWNKKGHKIE